MKALLLLMLAILALLYGGECHAQWVRLDKDTIKLDGDITRDSYENYLAVAKPGYSKVILRSAGGTPKPALLIAQDMLSHHPQVIVDDYCLSACANYLLFASPAPTVTCGALLIWHGSPSLGVTAELQKMKLDDKPAKLIQAYADWAKRFEAMEVDYFARVGISRKILTDSVAIVDRERVAPEKTFSFDDMTGDYSETASAGLWIPTTRALRAYGMDTKHFCPSYDQDIPQVLKRLKLSAPYTTAGP
jgi:hypothetical protein